MVKTIYNGEYEKKRLLISLWKILEKCLKKIQT